ncbi:Rap1a/Tai family immunity protein [Aeromonas media]|uniref:Rap1a/Tai family immunity protein n=1 Tax=Aeromonas media TaxID=651 RepID=UPI001117AF10|nr:Rap1a/Tai family immunity protein [Aeromonas media]
MMFRLIPLAIVFSLLSFSSHAVFYSGNDILDRCSSDERNDNHFQINAFCMGYLVGVYDSYEGITICPENNAKNITIGQLQLISVKYMREHPEKLNGPAIDLIEQGLNQAFPCKNK